MYDTLTKLVRSTWRVQWVWTFTYKRKTASVNTYYISIKVQKIWHDLLEACFISSGWGEEPVKI